MVEPKDVVVGILGASVALTGLILVFSGFIFAQAASFPPTTDDQIIKKYTTAARLALLPFWTSLVTTILSLIWLLHHSPYIYAISVFLFFALVIGTGIYGTVASYRYL